MDSKTIILFAIIIGLILLLAFWDNIHKIFRKVDDWFPLTTLKNWFLVLLGVAIGFEVQAMMASNWVGLVYMSVLIVGILIAIAIIDRKSEQKRRKDLQEDIQNIVKTTVKETIAELKRDGII